MKCHKTGCDSAACFHVGLDVMCLGIGRHRQHITAPTSIKVCHAHMEDAGHYVLSPVNKSNIARGLLGKGYAMPDFSSAEIVFVPISAKPDDFGAAREARH